MRQPKKQLTTDNNNNNDDDDDNNRNLDPKGAFTFKCEKSDLGTLSAKKSLIASERKILGFLSFLQLKTLTKLFMFA